MKINIEREQKYIAQQYHELKINIFKEIEFADKLSAKFTYYECIKIIDKYIEQTIKFETYTHSILRQIKEDLLQEVKKL